MYSVAATHPIIGGLLLQICVHLPNLFCRRWKRGFVFLYVSASDFLSDYRVVFNAIKCVFEFILPHHFVRYFVF
jgi:hypothetical protein